MHVVERRRVRSDPDRLEHVARSRHPGSALLGSCGNVHVFSERLPRCDVRCSRDPDGARAMSEHQTPRDRKLGRRARIAVFAGIIVVAAAAPAFAYWVVSVAYANGNYSLAQADTLPAGATPTAATTPAANSNTVGLTFNTSATTTSGAAVTSYLIYQVRDRFGTRANYSFTCTPPAGTFTCTDNAVPDGSWQYTVSATIAGYFVDRNTECAEQLGGRRHDAADHDGQLPGFERLLQQRQLDRRLQHLALQCDRQHLRYGYRPRNLRQSGVASVAVSVQSVSGATAGKYWGGSSFDQSSEDQLPATYSGGDWTLPFPASTSRPTAATSSGSTAPTMTATSSLRARPLLPHRQHAADGRGAGSDRQRHLRL